MFTNPNYAATLPQTDMECSDLEVMQNNFIGEYCEKCIKRHNRCWCDKSDWEVDLMEVELPKDPTNQNINKTNNAEQLNSLTLVSIRQPPPGWSEYRRGVINKRCKTQTDNESKTNGQGKTGDENPMDKVVLKGIRLISTREFEEM